MRLGRTRARVWAAAISMCLCACSSGGGGDDDDDGDDPPVDDDASPPDASIDAAPPDTDGGATCSGCAASLFGRYVVRCDGAPLFQTTNGQEPILELESGDVLVDVESVHDGLRHGCARLGTAETAWCWRINGNDSNFRGQLGNGTLEPDGPTYRATQVLTADGPLGDVAAISYAELNGVVEAGATCAATTTGELHCWGDLTHLKNNQVQLYSPYAVPILTDDGVTPLSGVVQVAVNVRYACAVVAGKETNQLWCWGENTRGQLGQGDLTFRRYPTLVNGVDNPTKAVTQGYGVFASTCAIDDSRVRCWGANHVGQTGNNSLVNPTLAPSLVQDMAGAPLDDVVDLHGGFSQFCALRSDRTIWCWGQAYDRYAAPYATPDVALLGGTQSGPRYLTTDGVYHVGNTSRDPNCGELP